MKNLHFIVITSFLVLGNSNCFPTQNKEGQSINMIKEFYSAYITEMITNSSIRVLNDKLDSIQKIYCSEKLLKTIPDIVEETRADAFLKAQDSNLESLETLIVKKDSTRTNGYIVSYSDDYSKKPITISLTVIKEKGRLKIDSIR